jgi:hypothetical protein
MRAARAKARGLMFRPMTTNRLEFVLVVVSQRISDELSIRLIKRPLTGNTLIEAMTVLEARLRGLSSDQLHFNSDWASAVDEALYHLRRESQGCVEFGGLEGKLPTLPKTFAEICASRIEARARVRIVGAPKKTNDPPIFMLGHSPGRF